MYFTLTQYKLNKFGFVALFKLLFNSKFSIKIKIRTFIAINHGVIYKQVKPQINTF